MKNKLSVKKYEDGMYSLSSKNKINTTINNAWSFFTKPKNLSKLSPENVKFKIISGKSDSFYEGKIISYKIKILPFIHINWTTEITKIIENKLFIDKQIFGPYKLWVHEHHFTKNNDGSITISDKIKYKLYLHPFSKILHKLFIKKKLFSIFTFRRTKIKEIFNNSWTLE